MNDSTENGPGEFWTRLRRGKVVQWGLVYVVGAWGLLQGIGFVADAFHWPDATKQVATLALFLGLPIVLVLAWYHGDRGHQRVSATELAIIALLCALGGGILWRYARVSETTTTATAERPPPTAVATATDHSIAVLPFVNMSSDKEQEYFADGISEELLNLLAQVPELRVIARTSSFSFKGKDVDIAEIARRLNVTNVLEGSVRKSGDTLRITAQLVRASDSSHLWSQTYDRQMTDVFKVQDEIAAAVVEQLKVKLLGAAPKRPVTDPDAYTLFLQGREVVARQYNREAFEQAIALYRQALTIDPSYAPAWNGLANVYFGQIDLDLLTANQGLALGREAIRNALEHDPSFAPAYGTLAKFEGLIERDYAAAARPLERALALDPANLEIVNVASHVARRLGRLELAIALGKYQVERDPVSATGYDALGAAYRSRGQFAESIAAYRKVVDLSPDAAWVHMVLGSVLLQTGDADAALAEFRKEPSEAFHLYGLAMAYHALGWTAAADVALAELIQKYTDTKPLLIAAAQAYRGDFDQAFEMLEKADRNHDLELGALAVYPSFAPMRKDPRWLPLLRRLGLAPEQLAAIKFDVKVPQ